jgi:hypothetical protein
MDRTIESHLIEEPQHGWDNAVAQYTWTLTQQVARLSQELERTRLDLTEAINNVAKALNK